MSTEQEDKQNNKLMEQYSSIVEQLMKCNRKQTIEYFLKNLVLEDE